ncbi:MAG: phosphatase PAP2 family protein [Flavobacteriaceae bacterium]|nr:phosphatase PAP2 family protein [Flavobacteriaceae bacterium]MDH3795710.1 phosphatase PAP2 family protein [Flavobacteriaceae bacterium]
MDKILQVDRDVFLSLNSLGSETWDGLWMAITNKYYAIPLYALILWITLKKLGLKRTLISLVAIALLILVTDQLANFFKYGVQRLRPCYDPELNTLARLVKASCGGKFSFYSAHASNSMAIASFFFLLLHQYRKTLGVFLLIWAVLVGYSRIYIGVHFPLDVLFGMGIGALMGWLFYKLSIFTFFKSGL